MKEQYSTYRHYIMATGKPDTLENYREYCRLKSAIYRAMKPGLFAQSTAGSYLYRFAIQF